MTREWIAGNSRIFVFYLVLMAPLIVLLVFISTRDSKRHWKEVSWYEKQLSYHFGGTIVNLRELGFAGMSEATITLTKGTIIDSNKEDSLQASLKTCESLRFIKYPSLTFAGRKNSNSVLIMVPSGCPDKEVGDSVSVAGDSIVYFKKRKRYDGSGLHLYSK